jgi:GT2 family glycosyltransferase
MLTVVVVNWNGRHLLPGCLGSLRNQTFAPFETLVVDNGSTDGSIELIRAEYPEVRLIEAGRNLGLAAGTNLGVRESAGEFIATLNNDTEVDPCWLAELVHGLERHPAAGSAASKMLLFDRRDTFHAAGDFYGLDGVPGNRGVWQRDSGQFDSEQEVFGACAGAALYRRSMLEEIGLFDESLFMYCEDVDLGFRAQLAGYRCVYVPTAVVYHMLSATGGGPTASYYCGRNFLRVAFRNLPSGLLAEALPRLVCAQVGFALESVRHLREPAARARLRGQLRGLRDLPRLLHQRRQIQSTRRVPLAYLRSVLGAT